LIVTNLAQLAERVVALYNQRGTAEHWIKEEKGAIQWTRLSCLSFWQRGSSSVPCADYNLGNFMRTCEPGMPAGAEPWLLTSLREKLIKIGAKVANHGRYVMLCKAPRTDDVDRFSAFTRPEKSRTHSSKALSAIVSLGSQYDGATGSVHC
jgi:hypothetical protein